MIVITLKVNESKLYNQSKLSEQINRVVKLVAERINLTFDHAICDIGTVNDDILNSKVTLRIKYTLKQ